ncbi:MAG: sigma-70 family RNA polymerase sigma factor [Bacteroidia bacterium]|nr:sigma-70 family RNA polymerase sigma factor [Bacteroidia bacterium]
MSKKQRLSDQEIIDAIKEGGLKREKVSTQLYRDHIKYASMKLKGVFLKPEERRDAYNWTLSKVCQSIASDSFRRKAKISTFIYESYRNACIDVQRSNTSNKMENFKAALELWASNLPAVARESWKNMDVDQQDLWEKAKAVINRLGDKCRELIWKIDYLGYSLAEMAKELKYSSSASVASTKNRCMKELRTKLGVN